MPIPWTALAILGAGLYQGSQAASAARKQAATARERTAQAKDAAQKQIAQMQADAAARSTQFNEQIAQSRAQTQASIDAADQATQQAQAAQAQQAAQSNLMIHQQQLQSAIARQRPGSVVSKAKRTAKRGTPESMRTKLTIDSGLGGGASGSPGDSSTGLGTNV